MGKLEALVDLLEEIKAGSWPGSRMYDIFTDPEVGIAFDAFNGSLDAALALHDAVLPGWVYVIAFDAHRKLYALVGDGILFETDEAYDENPARAWLMAILQALIAQARDE